MKIEVFDIETADGTRHAYLVNPEGVFPSKCRETGKTRIHYQGAIDCGTMRGGMVRVAMGEGLQALIEPRPCVFVPHKKPRTNTLAWLGVSEKSAIALLHMASAGTNVRPDFQNATWAFEGPLQKGVPVGWQGGDWIVAWRFNWWLQKGMKGDARIADLATLGIAITAGNLRQKLRRMRLVTDRTR